MARVIFVNQIIPRLPGNGGQMRTFGLLQRLAALHDVTVVTGVRPGEEDAVAALRQFCRVECIPMPPDGDMPPGQAAGTVAPGIRQMLRHRLRRLRHLVQPLRLVLQSLRHTIFEIPSPFLNTARFRTLAAETIRALLSRERYDIIQAETLDFAYMRRLLPDAPLFIADLHDVYSEVYRDLFLRQRHWYWRLHFGVEFAKMVRMERAILSRLDGVIAVSERDAAMLRPRLPRVPVWLVRNAIDTSTLAALDLGGGDEPVVLFTGTMSYQPNVDAMCWFAEQMWPGVRAHCPEAKLLIVGNRPDPAVAALAGRAGIHVTGYVEDVAPYFRQARVYVNPMRLGGGTNFKMLEAMAAGRAIVSTRKGARGLRVAHGEHVLLADAPAEFAAAVVRLLDDRALALRLSQNARALACRDYDIGAAARALDEVYAGLLRSGDRRGCAAPSEAAGGQPSVPR